MYVDDQGVTDDEVREPFGELVSLERTRRKRECAAATRAAPDHLMNRESRAALSSRGTRADLLEAIYLLMVLVRQPWWS